MSLAIAIDPVVKQEHPALNRTGGKIVACWGANGSGKSAIALNLAFELASLGQKTILVDADSHRPSLAALLGFTGNGPGLTAVLRLARAGRLNSDELNRLTEEISFASSTLRLITGMNSPSRWRELDGQAFSELLEFLRCEFDYVVLDIAGELEEGLYSDTADISRNHASLELTKQADQVLGCFCSDPVGISRFLWDARDAGFEFLPVANRVRNSVLGRNAERQVRDTMFKLARLEVFAMIPEDGAALDAAQQRAQPLLLAAKSSKAREAIRQIALLLMDQSDK